MAKKKAAKAPPKETTWEEFKAAIEAEWDKELAQLPKATGHRMQDLMDLLMVTLDFLMRESQSSTLTPELAERCKRLLVKRETD